MERSTVERRVLSQHVPEQVEVSGFGTVDDSVHMIEWIRKGKDFRQFIVNDIEAELYAQDQGAQLLSVNCKAKPDFETKLKPDPSGRQGIVTYFSVTFPILLRVKAANGAIWKLEVQHNYQASNLDVPDKFQLRLNFTIIGHEAES
jgi:hypothetical protein